MKDLVARVSAVFLIVSAIQTGYAQVPVDLKPVRFTIGLVEPSVVAEFKIGAKQTIATTGGITIGVTDEKAYVFPVLRGSFRHYYDRKRVKKSNLRSNSGNFITLQGGYYFDAIGDAATTVLDYFIGPAWGIQRNYNSGIHLSLSLGLGYGNGQNIDGQVTGAGHFTFGFTFN